MWSTLHHFFLFCLFFWLLNVLASFFSDCSCHSWYVIYDTVSSSTHLKNWLHYKIGPNWQSTHVKPKTYVRTHNKVTNYIIKCYPTLQVWTLSIYLSLSNYFSITSIYQNMIFFFEREKKWLLWNHNSTSSHGFLVYIKNNEWQTFNWKK